MELSKKSIEEIVVAVLAVNNYSLEKAHELLPELRSEGLTNPHRVARKDAGDLTVALSRAGYNRGMLTGLMAERLLGLMEAITDGELEAFEGLLRSGEQERALTLLRKVHGIGPQVAANVWMLLKG